MDELTVVIISFQRLLMNVGHDSTREKTSFELGCSWGEGKIRTDVRLHPRRFVLLTTTAG